MIYSNLIDIAPNQLTHTPPPEHGVFYTRPPKVQSPGKFSAQDVPYIIKFDEISERARERTEQRRLRRIATFKIQATFNSYGVESPGANRALKSHTPPLPPDAPSEVPNQPHVPTKLTRTLSNRSRSNRNHQLHAGSPPTTLVVPRRASSAHELRIPYSESRGELQRQFAITQRLHYEHYLESQYPVEAVDYRGGRSQSGDAGIHVHGLRLRAEKLLQKVSAPRIPSDKRNVAHLGKSKKVRFATVVECFEF